mmetsp:Transcript_96223/g.294318  ORF Transcript_96223/g.294318 Transcript_96223/m.294318 type:complete len:229 (-) Transcript_96223:569-1255(-)
MLWLEQVRLRFDVRRHAPAPNHAQPAGVQGVIHRGWVAPLRSPRARRARLARRALGFFAAAVPPHRLLQATQGRGAGAEVRLGAERQYHLQRVAGRKVQADPAQQGSEVAGGEDFVAAGALGVVQAAAQDRPQREDLAVAEPEQMGQARDKGVVPPRVHGRRQPIPRRRGRRRYGAGPGPGLRRRRGSGPPRSVLVLHGRLGAGRQCPRLRRAAAAGRTIRRTSRGQR